MKNPLVSAYTVYGSLLAITDDNIMTWIYNHMTHIIYVKSWRIYTHSLHYPYLRSCPFIDIYSLPKAFLLANWNNSIIDFLTDLINTDFYIFINVDQYYIKKSVCYGKKHFFHELLIFGYNQTRKVFYAADNFEYGKYVQVEIPYDEIEIAYNNLQSKYGYETDINFLRPNNKSSIPISLDRIITGIEFYLSSQPIYTDHDYDCVYGIQTISHLHDSLNEIVPGMFLDIRPFHVMYEHKMLMRMRVEYLLKKELHNNLIEKFAFLEEGYIALRNIVIKYNYTNNTKLINSIQGKLKEYMIIEEDVLGRFLEIISKHNIE